MSWFTLPAGTSTYRLLKNKISSCTGEVDIEEADFQGHEYNDKKWNSIAPLRVLSFDIEVENTVGFPTPDKNRVITIGIVCKRHSKNDECRRVVLQLDSCEPIFDTLVLTFDKEHELLEAFDSFISSFDPDIIIGYNIIGFDLNYLLNRWKQFPQLDFPRWGRYLDVETKITKGRFQAKIMGFRELLNINMEGRIQIDLLAHMMREKKLRSYSLNFVSYTFLNEQKEDVNYKIIFALQNGDASTRKRIATYCVKDALLPLLLFEKLKCLYNYVEMSRVTGVTVAYILFKGQ